MKKILVTLATIAVVGFSLIYTTDTIHAKSLQDIKDERAEIKKNLSDAEEKIADVLIDLKEINEEIAQVEASLKANQEAKKEVQAEMDKLQEEIEELEAAIEERFDILKQRAKSYQRTGGNIAYLDVILGSSSFIEFISRVNAITTITESDAELIKLQEEDKEKVEQKLEQQNELKEELEAMEQLIIEQKEENEKRKSELKKKESEFKKLKSNLQVKDKKLAEMEESILSSMATSSSSGSSDSASVQATAAPTGGGVLAWPTQGGYISSHMGNRGGRLHKGIDIARTNRSTSPPIFAADSGTVVSAGSSGAYGNRVVIDHNNGMRTIYAHLSSISVKSGQNVSRGSKIGVMGATGRSTGIHLHFEVYVNGSLQNPMNYLR